MFFVILKMTVRLTFESQKLLVDVYFPVSIDRDVKKIPLNSISIVLNKTELAI